jgi:DNA polymerase III subunit epsilon
MNTLIFDTETTGLVAANYLIQPDGWTMDAKASEITGLTDAMAKDYGTHLVTGVEFFLDMVKHADIIVAHNARFDITVMRRAAFVYYDLIGSDYVDPFEGKTMICTMLAALDIVKATPKRGNQWKWPKLVECTQFFFNEDIDGAHDALVDVRATARVYYHMLDEGVFTGEYRH